MLICLSKRVSKPITQNMRGFTLIELLIVVTIMVLVTGAVIPSFAGYIRNQNLKQAQEQVKSDLRTAQNKALTGALSDQTVNSNPVAYWGVRFHPQTATDYNAYDLYVSDTNTGCPNSFVAGQLQETLEISNELNFKSNSYQCVYFSLSNGATNSLNFPSSRVLLGYTTGSDPGDCRKVVFNGNGLIYSTNDELCN